MREALVTVLWFTLLTGLAPAAAADLSLEREAELERLVLQDCGSCHGLTLKGGLGPDIRAETLAGIPPEALTEIVLDGIPGTAMPPWRPLLSEDDARWIADFLLKGDVE
ncbi:c-type cytochrome [Denitrobaculum tricleocarpae]|uniref:Cytochrome c n=1 Tax=Denitrobaculum tricleocarpae TaxID=2591009 RepID=A0A545TMR7_9PROT|nr:cytochrome c [Denitrobaculum tricleocarpae]TQV78527.1 cytochrome c [Denitrobaculum tricleocarpae]